MEISSWARRTLSLGIAAMGIQSASCTDSRVGPEEPSTLSVSVTVAGVDADEEFAVSLDNGEPRRLSPSAGVVIRFLASGQHTVALSGIQQNCTVAGPNPLTVDASPGETKSISFRVSCTATSGFIAVTIPVTGTSESLWFGVQIDTARTKLIKGNEKTVVGKFSGGQHSIRMLDIPTSCAVNGDSSTMLSISTGGITPDTIVVDFDVSCNPNSDRKPSGVPVIAFQRGNDVAVMDEDGSNVRLLAPGVAPSFSPNGDFIAFQRTVCASSDCNDYIWTIGPDGSGDKQITKQPGFYDSTPAVSPSGDRIAFVRFWYGPDQTYLMVTDVNGGSERILSIWDPINSSSNPAWSPDGSHIAFACERGPDLCVVPTSPGCTSYFVNQCGLSGNAIHLTSTGTVESQPSWSPDGTLIALTLDCSVPGLCAGGMSGLHVGLLDLATQIVTPLVEGSNPTWSPDGKRIVFDSPNATGLSIINKDGTGLRQLTTDTRDSAASWRLR